MTGAIIILIIVAAISVAIALYLSAENERLRDREQYLLDCYTRISCDLQRLQKAFTNPPDEIDIFENFVTHTYEIRAIYTRPGDPYLDDYILIALYPYDPNDDTDRDLARLCAQEALDYLT